MNLPLRFLAEVENDLDEAAAWYNSKSAGLGLEFINDVEATLSRIVQSPLETSRVEGIVSSCGEIRWWLLLRFPYSIVYLTSAAEISIIAVAHGARRPGSWSQRLDEG